MSNNLGIVAYGLDLGTGDIDCVYHFAQNDLGLEQRQLLAKRR